MASAPKPETTAEWAAYAKHLANRLTPIIDEFPNLRAVLIVAANDETMVGSEVLTNVSDETVIEMIENARAKFSGAGPERTQ